jgi:hypothetical protein
LLADGGIHVAAVVQAALRESLRATQAAETERDRLREQLADTTAQEAAAAREAAAAARIHELLQSNGGCDSSVHVLLRCSWLPDIICCLSWLGIEAGALHKQHMP